MNPTDTPATGDHVSAYRWLLAWVVLLIILWAISKFRAGYIILYYLAVLTLAFILLTQYKAIAYLLSPFNGGQKKS